MFLRSVEEAITISRTGHDSLIENSIIVFDAPILMHRAYSVIFNLEHFAGCFASRSN
jgi:hypothetical protein